MSKLVEQLERVARGSAPRLGFSPAVVERLPSLLLLASAPAEDLASVPREGGLAALLVQAEGGPFSRLSPHLQALAGLTWGVSGAGWDAEDISWLKEAGGDVLVFPPGDTPASTLTVEGLGKILTVDPSLPDSSLRAWDVLPVDAVLLDLTAGGRSFLTVEQLVTCYRVVGLIRKPLLIQAHPDWGREELIALRDAGVVGIVIPLPAGLQALEHLRQTILALPARRRARGRAEPLLPSLRVAPEPTLPDQPPEPDEDDEF